MIRTIGWLPEVELDQIQRNINKEENTEEPRSELQNTCDHRMITGSQDEDNIEVTNAKNFFNKLQDQGLTDDEIRLVEEVAEQIKTDKAPPNLRNIERK